VSWLTKHGADVNVAVFNTGTSAGRLLMAAEVIERGDLLAAIPLDMAFSQVTHGGNSSMEVRAISHRKMQG
jgi:hypothetical protein